MTIKKLFPLLALFISSITYSQCFEIESILVDACDSGGTTPDEGYNEMVRFRIGSNPLNTSNLSINWPSNTWQGLIQNATTASKVAQLNQNIAAAGGCGILLEPTAGVLPANSTVIIVTSQNFNTSANSFGALTSNCYIIFQDNTTVTSGHFGNYNATPATRTLTITFGSGCSDSVTYQRANLVNIFGNIGGNSSELNGSTVNFTASGTPTYVNNGCIAPIQPFTVDAGNTPVSACPGQTINLIGTAQGQTSILWTALTGNFSTPNALGTSYTIPSNAVIGSSISLTLSNTNSCNHTITDQIDLNVVSSNIPTFTQIAPICSGSALLPLPTISTNGITGSWSPAINNTATTTYTFTPDSGQCATTATMTINVDNPSILHITKDDPNCNPNQLSWSSVNTINPTVAITTIGSNTITITKPSGGLFSTPDVYNGSIFPPQYNLPINSTTLANDSAGLFTFCYNTPVVNPQIAISSIGNSSTPVTINTSVPYQVIWAGTGVTYSNNQTLEGIEGNCIIVFPGTHQCISFDYLTAEHYCNIVFGSQDSNCQIDPICEGESVTLAAHGSSNITWSPTNGLTYLPNNKVIASPTTTTTYTITSNDACQNQASITVTVNPNVIPTFTQVAAICSGATLSALPTTSTNGITGTWSPVLDNTTTTTYTFTPTAGQCATSASMTITVNPNITPTFTQVAAICSGASLAALPTTSTNGITGTWSPVLDNTTTTTYTFTPTAGQCATTATMTITVNPNVTPTFTQVSAICSGAALSALPTTSINGITGTWSPALNNTTTTTYTFTPTAGQCATTATMTITVNPNVTPTFTQVAAICSGAMLSALPTTSTNGITGTWSPVLNNTTTTTYTFTPTAGQCATTATMTITVNPNVTPTFTQVAAICSGTSLAALPTTSTNGITGTWSPVLNNTTTTTYTFTPDAGQCATTATMTITVNPNVTPTFTQVAAICSGTSLAALPTTSTNGITGTWSPALNNTTTTTYTFTPTAGQCATTATMTITVNDFPVVTFTGNLSYCNETMCSITLTSNQPNTTYTWNVVSSNLGTGTNQITSGTGSTIVQELALLNNLNQGFATYLVTPTANECIGNAIQIPILVNPIPNVTLATTQNSICSGEMAHISFTSTIAATQFSWVVTSQIGVTGASSGTGQSIDQTLVTTSPVSSGTVTYLVTPVLNGCVGIPKSITITVNPRPEIIGSLIPQFICSGETTNITVAASIAGTQFSWQVIDANQVMGYSNGTGGVIQQILTTVGDLQGYVIYEVTPSLNGCLGIPKQYKVFVNPLPKPVLLDGPICVSTSGIPYGTYELNTDLNTIDYEFSWYLNGNLIAGSGASLIVNQPGTYVVKVKNSHTNCEGQATALVFPITPATSMNVLVSEAFSDNPTITVFVLTPGNGNLLYQLDQGAYQQSNVFYQVEEGLHAIHVIDQEGCTDLIQSVRVINYPKFFTPNGDGYNDTWNITGFRSEENVSINIFDRYGKLIKQLFTPGIGWDGTYLGQQLPSTDYWFTVEYTEQQQRKLFKSHFSLKR